MKVSELRDGMVVKARTGRYSNLEPQPVWSDWLLHRLYVQRDRQGQICTLTTMTEPGGWAEYDPRHDIPVDGTFEFEGYYFQIDGLEDK